MTRKASNRAQPRHDFPFYRALWNRAMLLNLLPVVLVFTALGIWIYYSCPAPGAGLLLLTGGFLVVGASLVYYLNGLLGRLEKKRLNINLLDQQLLKMSRMAAATRVTRDFLDHAKDVFINIDSAAALARDMIDRNNLMDLKETLSQIESESARARKSIDNLLTLTRLPGNRWIIQEIDINQLLTDILELFAPEFHSKGIRIRQRLEHRLPVIRSNFSRLYQVIQNLFLAAVSDIEPGGELLVATAALREGVRIETTYRSLHFDEHVLSRLADPACALQSKEPGPWLALCLYHADRVNGRIEAEKADSGLKFTVTLPYRLDKPSIPPPRSFLKGL